MVRQLKLGGHLPAGEGLHKVVLDARALNYNIIQLMVGDRTKWDPYPFNDQATMEYRKMTYGIDTYVHLPFLINPCSAEKRRFGRVTLKKFARVAQAIGARAMVLHPGYKQDLTEEVAYENFLRFFDGALADFEIKMPILLETDAGSKNGSKIGSLEFIAKAIEDLGAPEFAMCLDTTHLYARGIDLWDDIVRKQVLEKYGTLIQLIHLNVPDAECTLGSFVDRHNTPFEEFSKDSTGLLKDLIPRWPVVLERASLAVQNQDVQYILQALGTVKEQIKVQIKEEIQDEA